MQRDLRHIWASVCVCSFAVICLDIYEVCEDTGKVIALITRLTS